MKAYAWNQALPFCFETIVTIPITVLIFCETELPSLLYLHSTQLQQNLILDTEKTGLKWTPLSSNKRVNILTEQKDITPDFSFITDIPPGEEARDQLIKFAEPYIYRTEDLKKLQAEKKKLENYRHIPFEIEFHGKKISDYYTKQSGDWPEFATTILDDSNFPTDDEKLRDELVPVLKEAVEKEREKRIKDIQDSIDKIENLDEGIKNATIVKVYPTHPHLVLKDTYNLKINGALGNAHEFVGYQGYSKRTMDRNIRRSLSAGFSIYGRPTLLKDFLKGSDSEEEKKSTPLPLQDTKTEAVGVPKKADNVVKTEKAKEPKKKSPTKTEIVTAEVAEVAEEKMDVEKEPTSTTETTETAAAVVVVADPHPEPSEASRQSRKRKRADKESKKGKRTNTF